ncbi:MAG: B12-binding domain-containing radical SAM protein [Ignavibacteriaceae bacterium]
MKILLGQSYFRILDEKEQKRNMPYPPLGSLYAATVLKGMGHEVIFYDAMLSSGVNDFISKISYLKPDLLIIYDDEFNYLTKMCLSKMRDSAIASIKWAKKLYIPVLVYSSDATDFPAEYYKAECDAIIYGEGEETLKEVIKAFEEGSFLNDRDEIAGLKFIKNGLVCITPSRKLIDNLDLIPDPDYSFVNIEAYRNIWLNSHGYFSMNISTTRGCPYSCNWCAKPLYGRTYSSRSPKNVTDQIKFLKENYFIEHLWITDDIFGLKTNWIKEFSVELEKADIRVPYKCLSRPDLLLKGDTLYDLKESGCKTIWIGAESGSQKILDAMDKGTTVKQIYHAANKAHELGIEIAFFIQFGYLDENWEDIKLTRKMIIENLPDDIGISVSYPLPGTKFYQKVNRFMNDKTNWTDSDDLDTLFNGYYGRNYYKLLHRFVHNEYRLIKIIKGIIWKDYPRLFIYSIRYIIIRARLYLYYNT